MGAKNEYGKYCGGLTTKVALSRLHEEIASVLKIYENGHNEESLFTKIRSAFVKRYDSPFGWFSILTTIVVIVGLLIANCYFPAIVILFIFCLNLHIVIRENNLRRTEIFRKVHQVLDEIKLASEELSKDWEIRNYPHLCCPLSPCVSLQWTYRDGIIINLPWALLVKGDHIVLRPGQIAPGPCSEVNGKRKFKANETYGISQPVEPPTKPTARSPLPDLICSLENTPFLNNLQIMLKNFLKRPPTIYNQQRYLLVTKYIQQWGTVTALIITLLAGILRFTGFSLSGHSNQNWKEIFLETPISSIIPVLPLIFPLLWISVNLWGVARLSTFLCIPQPQGHTDNEKSFQEDLDTPTYEFENTPLPRAMVFNEWISLWKGDGGLLGRSANVVQVLGSITALCCVDKKGILSWPNPTAEKVFFLRDSAEDKIVSVASQTSLESEATNNNNPTNPANKSGVIAEVLDLTHDQHCPFKLEFDDHGWKNHISSLKPLGLAILLNTCSPLTHAHYAQFCGHVTAVAMLDKDLVPVTNRYAIVESSLNCFMHGRCLCELAKQIGFTSHATDRFVLEGQLGTYRHLQPEVVKRDIRFARHFQLSSKVKVPFPHSLSVVLREAPGGYLSLFTQGTADIILDCCDDFWDGKDLRPLGQQERKRAQDFYQRSALTAYCTAFAYRPLRHSICGALSGSEKNGHLAYLELPPESKYRMQHVDKSHCDFECHTKLAHSISTDSLLFSETKDINGIADVEGCFEMQCHQVFIGMITMQYQAQMDIVQLVERLERACIRFVHFSKENELRSRVFSEKMGLESGWNCHISLLSEDPHSNPQSPKSSGGNINSNKSPNSTRYEGDDSNFREPIKQDSEQDSEDINCLALPIALESTKTLSSSAPGAISNQDYNMLNVSHHASTESLNDQEMDDMCGNSAKISGPCSDNKHSEDSALDENCRSLSCLTDSTEQSAPVHFDMSNRAKLPRGIENIRPHLEKVDNVPLQVSLFTDCSAEATREMLSIMQSYGEIVVCIGSSASNANAEIFLQADCSIAVEPLYPQVCQDIPAYTESNILNNKLHYKRSKSDFGKTMYSSTQPFIENGLPTMNSVDSCNDTLSPIYLSRILNSLPCSIAVRRDDPLSIVAIIELSRRFSLGLWNCIQFWACCGCSLAIINILSACLSLPPIYTPFVGIYLMCCVVPSISLSLTHIEMDSKIMNRATGKKQTKFDSRVFGFVLWCYGCKFLPVIIIMVVSYCTFLAHPVEIIDVDEDKMEINLRIARTIILLGTAFHFVIISASFVHRDHSMWQKSPFTNNIWLLSCSCVIFFSVIICNLQIFLDSDIYNEIPDLWPVVLFTLTSVIFSFVITEFCKWEEIKFNLRYQRRARLDFGTKLGMNSPF